MKSQREFRITIQIKNAASHFRIVIFKSKIQVMGNCCCRCGNTITVTCDHSDYENPRETEAATRQELSLNEGTQTQLLINPRNESPVSFDCNSFGCPGSKVRYILQL